MLYHITLGKIFQYRFRDANQLSIELVQRSQYLKTLMVNSNVLPCSTPIVALFFAVFIIFIFVFIHFLCVHVHVCCGTLLGVGGQLAGVNTS